MLEKKIPVILMQVVPRPHAEKHTTSHRMQSKLTNSFGDASPGQAPSAPGFWNGFTGVQSSIDAVVPEKYYLLWILQIMGGKENSNNSLSPPHPPTYMHMYTHTHTQ